MYANSFHRVQKKSIYLSVPLLIGLTLFLLLTQFFKTQAATPLIERGAGTDYYVDYTASGTASGLDWTNAYTNVQAALAAAINGDTIHVASGVYTPGVNRTDTFALVNGVEMYGGYPNGGGTRHWDANPTVLSGDIDGNDGTDSNGVVTNTANLNGSNSYHVITSTNALSTTLLDGFIVTAGNADDTFAPPVCAGACGGGMYNRNSSPRLENILFSGNSAQYGGGMENASGSKPSLNNVTFFGNSATSHGGGIENDNSNPSLTNVTFFGNSADTSGGGLSNYQSSPTLNNVTFFGNSANFAGGLYNQASSPLLTNVTFGGNSAGTWGGGLYNFHSNPAIRNTIFWSNTAGLSDDAMGNDTSTPVLTNTLIQDGCPVDATCNGVLLTSDPLFVSNPDAGDGDWTTLDDNDYGDLRLQNGSPAINQGHNDFVSVLSDLDGNDRIVDGLVDLGAYENQASMSNLCFVEDADGNDVTDYASTDASAVQAAVDASSPGDLLKVAGTCAGVEFRNGFTQTLYLSQTLTLQGGYSESDWTTHMPEVYTTTLDAESGGRVIYIPNSSYVVVLDSLVIQNGESQDAGGVDYGGGVYAFGTNLSLTVNNSLIQGNSSNRGGGIQSRGWLTVTHSRFYNNSGAPWGGGLHSSGTSFIRATTFISNTGSNGEGAFNDTAGRMTIVNSTFIDSEVHSRNVITITNSTMSGAYFSGNAFDNYDGIAYIYYSTIAENNVGIQADDGSQTYLVATIVAENGTNCDDDGGTVTDNGHNLEDANECTFTQSTSMTNTNPLLMPFGDYGGDTWSYELQINSPARDAIGNGVADCGTSFIVDQRGFARPHDTHCDMGAVESRILGIYLPIIVR